MTIIAYTINQINRRVNAAACYDEARWFVPPLSMSSFQRTIMFTLRSDSVHVDRLTQRRRGSVLGLRPPGEEFRILCLQGSV